MSVELPKDRNQDHEISYYLLEPDEAKLSEPVRIAPPLPPSNRMGFTVAMDEPVELEPTDAPVTAVPAMALRLTGRFTPGHEASGCQREFVALLGALDDFDRSLGGHGLILDPSLSGGTQDQLTVVLRPLDVRRSMHRFLRMAELLVTGPVPRVIEQPPVHLDGEHLAAVTALFAQRDAVDTESARDRVQRWRSRQKSLAGLRMELVYPKAH